MNSLCCPLLTPQMTGAMLLVFCPVTMNWSSKQVPFVGPSSCCMKQQYHVEFRITLYSLNLVIITQCKSFFTWYKIKIHLTFWHRSFTFNSNKSPTWCNNFSVYYPDVCLQLNMFRAFSRLSSGTQWLQWQPLVLPSYRGDSLVINWKIVASGWWFISIVQWCTDLQTLNFTIKF